VAEQEAVRVLRNAWQAVEPRLRGCVDELHAPFPKYAGYHFGWCDATGEPANSRAGKAVRPALTLLACELVGGNRDAAVDAAAAVELVHNFSLIHDDVMDGDTERRNRRTVWSVFGVPVAILVGDALLTASQKVLIESEHPAAVPALTLLNRAVQRMLRGQMLDMRFESTPVVGLDACLSMVESKTAALLECACALGALYGGADDTTTRAVRGLGHHLGIAFQCADDLLGIWGDPRRTGKPVWSDLRSRKKSLPVVAALSGDTPAGWELARLYAGVDPLTDDQLARAADLVVNAGGQGWAQAAARRHYDEAMSCLRVIRPAGGAASEAKLALSTIAYLIVNREA
jgi:geranylgeranyl diphosphate synthase type I